MFDAIRHAMTASLSSRPQATAATTSTPSSTQRTAGPRSEQQPLSRLRRDHGRRLEFGGSARASRLLVSRQPHRLLRLGSRTSIRRETAGQGNATNTYTGSFNGTSGASPIVAGAAVLLQSWHKNRLGRVYDPEYLRGMMSSAQNIASANPATDRIGVMPNLRALIEAEIEVGRFRPARENYLAMVYILFGLIDDAPGVVWIPGRGPVPVDPGWGPIARTIVGPKRDLIASLAVNEITQTIEDQATRSRLADASVEAMRSAVDRIARMR